MNYILKKSEIVRQGKVFDLQVDEIQYESGNIGIREIALHPGGAVVVPLTKDYKILFVEQFRYPLQKYLLELPAGKLDKDEDPAECAARELEEETGYKASKITKLGAVASTPGFCTEILHIYLAEGLYEGVQNLEEGEKGLKVKSYSFKEVEKKIAEGEIYDAKTICGIYFAKLF